MNTATKFNKNIENTSSPKVTSNKEEMSFQADTKDLLKLMVNSIYTHKQIFLRELLSNASDAIDKIRFLSLTEKTDMVGSAEYRINIDIDNSAKTLTINDNGIGMSYQEVVDNIGTIAKSGTRSFLKQIQKTQDFDLIGQFGVGFYSAFMVAKKISLQTKRHDQEKGVLWESDGEGKFSIEKIDKIERGTAITLYLKDEDVSANTPQKDYTNQHTIRNLVEEYSNYIPYPIVMDMTRQEPPHDKTGSEIAGKEWTTIIESKTLNSMTPLWKKNKKDIRGDEYFKFYKHHFSDWNDYADVIHMHVEGKIEYNALLFIPGRAASDLYSKDSTQGIQLYSNSIFILNDCKELLPEYLRFVRGLVDSKDLSLNISREFLQHDEQLKNIGKNLEKKVLNSLAKLLKNERDQYENIWKEFGKAIKGGLYMDASNKEKLRDLFLFGSSFNDGAYTTFSEYVSRLGEGQKEIYYAANKDIESIRRMPQLEIFVDKDIEVLYFTDKIDEFLINNLGDYDNKKLVSVTCEDFNFDQIIGDKDNVEFSAIEKNNVNRSDNGQLEIENPTESGKQKLLKAIKENLGDRVEEVKFSRRLKNSPVCLVTTNSGTTFNMEQLLMGASQTSPKAKKILEINLQHPLFEALITKHKVEGNTSKFSNCCDLIYYQALLVEGYELDDPAKFSNQIADLMVDAYVSTN